MNLGRTLAALAISIMGFANEALAFAPGVVDTPYAAIGFDSTHAGLADGNENVDLFSGALTLQYVDHEIPGSWGLPIQVLRSYSSKVMDEQQVPYEESWVGLGWELHFGRYKEDTTAGSQYKWIELPGRGMERAYWLDSTEALYRGPTAANAFPDQYATTNELWVTGGFNFMYRSGATEYSVITTDGVVYVFDTSHGTAADGWTYCTEIYNAWGGAITISYSSATGAKPGAIDTVSNSESQSVVFTLDTSGYLDTMSYTASDGAAAVVNYTVGQPTTASAYVLQAVTLPTGETTALAYDPAFDELETITLPTGGVTTYSFDWVDFLWHVNANTTQVVYPTRVLASKVVDADPATPATYDLWTYDFPDYDLDRTQPFRVTTVELPTGGIIDHTFYCYFATFSPDYTIEYQPPQYIIGKPVSTEWFDSLTATVPRRRTTTGWDGADSEGNYLDIAVSVNEDPYSLSSLNARVVLPEYTATLQDPTGDADISSYQYFGRVATGAYDAFGNPVSQTDAEYMPYYSSLESVWHRRSEFTYAWEDTMDGAALSGWNLVHLPASEVMGKTDGSTITTTFRDVAWNYSSAAGFEGLVESYDSTAYPLTSNASSAEFRDYTWSFDRTLHLLKVSINHGGIREERKTWKYGTLDHDGFLKGTAMVWSLVRTVNGPTGLVTREENANGDGTDYTYDDSGRLLTVAPAVDDPTTATYSLTTTPPTLSVASAAGTITYTYDGVGRLLTTEQPNGTAATTTQSTEWDALGRAARVYLPYDGSSGGYVDTSFDVLDRPTEVDRVNTSTSTTYISTFAYSHLQMTALNARGYTTVTDVDGEGMVRTTDAATGADFKGRDYIWDGTTSTFFRGDYNFVRNSAGTADLYHQHRYLDGEGRLWRLDDSQDGSRYFVRNAAGDVAYEYDPAAHYIDYTAAYNGKPSRIDFQTSSTPSTTPEIGFFYDGDAMGTVPTGWTYANPAGNLTGIRDQAALEQYAYDDQNRISDFRRAFVNFGSPIVTQNYTRNAAGDIATINLAWSTRHIQTTYTYGDGDKVEAISVAVTDPNGTVTTSVLTDATYQPDGGYASLAFYNGVTQFRDVDGLSRTSGIYTTGASTDLDISLAWDANDNLSSMTDSAADTYTYDAIDRLTAVSFSDDSTGESYTWDEAGNMTNRTGISSTAFSSAQTYTNNHNNNSAWSYDSLGELTDDGPNTYTYDYRGRVATSNDGTNNATITYDYAGRRSVRAIYYGGVTQHDIYVYDILGRLAARYTASSTTATPLIQEAYVYLGNVPVAVVDYASAYPRGRVHWLHADHLGSQRMVTGSGGTVVGTQELLPFGDLRSTTGDMMQNDVSYAGHERFDTFQVADFGARSYHATGSAFVNPDRAALGSMDDPMSFNRYSYARGNPMKYVDPAGQMPFLAAALGAWAVADEALTVLDVLATGYAASQGDPMSMAMVDYAVVGQAYGPLVPNGGDALYVGWKYSPKLMTMMENRWVQLKQVPLAKKAIGAFSSEKQALIDMARADKRTGVTQGDMDAYQDLNRGLSDPFPEDQVRGLEQHQLRTTDSTPGPGQQPHGHVGPIAHIPERK